MVRFDYLNPTTLRQASSLLLKYGDEARIIAGCTDFLVKARQGVWTPKYVVNIKHIPGLERLQFSQRKGLRVGALTTFRTAETHPLIQEHFGVLSAAAHTAGGVQIRNLATLGGNSCNASPAADTIPALVALEATVGIYGPDGRRTLPIAELFAHVGRTTLKQGEILTDFSIPTLPPRTGGIFIKHSPRSQMDISVVGVAVVVTLAPGTAACTAARIALGAVAPVVFRARKAEAILRGNELTADVIARAAGAAAAEARPIDDVRAPADYRRDMVEALTRRATQFAVEMALVGMPISRQHAIAVEAAF